MEQAKPAFYRKPGGGYMRPVYKIEGLRKLADTLPVGDEGARSYGLALIILQHCFGHAWLVQHVLDEPEHGFLGRHVDGSDSGAAVVIHRIRNLAEMVVNLSPMQGVDAPFEQVFNGQIESGYAELEAGRLLSWASLPYRFIWASGVAGHDFDLEIVFPNGLAVCADTKCKIETGDFSANGIRNTLDGARKRNLPKGYPGAILLKVPSSWLETSAIVTAIEAVCTAFFRGTRRVVAVSLFAANLELGDGIVRDWYSGRDFKNPNHDYDDTLDWSLFSCIQQPLQPPPQWTKLTSFFH